MHKRLLVRACAAALTLWLGCGGDDDLMGTDAAPPADARPGADGGPPPPPPAVMETVAGAGRLSGGGLTLDVAVGYPVDTRPSRAGDLSLGGGATVNP